VERADRQGLLASGGSDSFSVGGLFVSTQDAMLQNKGFFASLFDLSFRSFITLRFIKVLYVILMVVLALVALSILVSFTRGGVGGFFVGLIVAAVFFVFYLIVVRLVLEFIVVVFRIGENTSILVDRASGDGSAPSTAGSPPDGLNG